MEITSKYNQQKNQSVEKDPEMTRYYGFWRRRVLNSYYKSYKYAQKYKRENSHRKRNRRYLKDSDETSTDEKYRTETKSKLDRINN